MCAGDGFRDCARWMENYTNLGDGHRQAGTCSWVCGRNGGSRFADGDGAHWPACQYDLYHHLRRHGRGCRQSSFCGSMGCDSSNCVCMDLRIPWSGSLRYSFILHIVRDFVAPVEALWLLLLAFTRAVESVVPQKRGRVSLRSSIA